VRLASFADLVADTTATIVGSPALALADSAARDSVRVLVDALRRDATLFTTRDVARPRPAATAGVCVTSADNWGEPSRALSAEQPCRGYAPTVHAVPRGGRLALDAPSRVQGALVVDGDLVLDAALDVTGLLVVDGAIDASRAPLRVLGSVVVRGAVHLGRGSVLSYSRCAATGAVLASAPLVPAGSGSWLAP
jgi:hypothetical protein